MRTEIRYEWSLETLDENRDIIDSDFADTLPDEWLLKADELNEICLVRNEGNEDEGVTDRAWAYVVDGKLPELFSDSNGQLNIKVPKRFHKELQTHYA